MPPAETASGRFLTLFLSLKSYQQNHSYHSAPADLDIARALKGGETACRPHIPAGGPQVSCCLLFILCYSLLLSFPSPFLPVRCISRSSGGCTARFIFSTHRRILSGTTGTSRGFLPAGKAKEAGFSRFLRPVFHYALPHHACLAATRVRALSAGRSTSRSSPLCSTTKKVMWVNLLQILVVTESPSCGIPVST